MKLKFLLFFCFRTFSENSDDIIKRDCAGFPCMYTHMAEKAGRASLFRALARIIDDCAADPRCNPGTLIFCVINSLFSVLALYVEVNA